MWSAIWSSFENDPARILMLGLDAAGKISFYDWFVSMYLINEKSKMNLSV